MHHSPRRRKRREPPHLLLPNETRDALRIARRLKNHVREQPADHGRRTGKEPARNPKFVSFG
jgi:hypothetical protein